MKYKIFSLIVFVAAATCKPTYEYVDANGVKQTRIIKEQLFVEVESKTTNFDSKVTCETGKTHVGLCCKCGFTINMKHECSCGMWRNCPTQGSQIISYMNLTTSGRKKLILEDGKEILFQNRETISSVNNEISRTKCE